MLDVCREQENKSLWSNSLRFCLLLKHNLAWYRWEFPTWNSCCLYSLESLFFIWNQKREVHFMSSYKVTGQTEECSTSLSHLALSTESSQLQLRHQNLREQNRSTSPFNHHTPTSSAYRDKPHKAKFICSLIQWVDMFYLNQLDWSKMYCLKPFYLISITANNILQIFFYFLAINYYNHLNLSMNFSDILKSDHKRDLQDHEK